MHCPVTSDEWVRYDDAAQRSGVPVGTIKVWVHRGKVRKQQLDRRTVFVNLDDVLHAEAAAWRRTQARAA